uniref:Ovule protein n=1 Tax=Ascaris lumbricoides TaxID=6252 RepID=A0A0M3IL08_ASCLU
MRVRASVHMHMHMCVQKSVHFNFIRQLLLKQFLENCYHINFTRDMLHRLKCKTFKSFFTSER